jgi:capsular exopolysaccharide synthesis family protein
VGKLTEALKKAADERFARLEKLDAKGDSAYEFIARKTVESNIDPRIVSFYEPDSPVAEQYRILRTNMQSLKSEKPIKAITITSASLSEGKTITAINLAISIARDLSKKDILLVDADLRRSRICKYLGVNADLGLTDLIANGAALDDALINIGVNNLTILPAGTGSFNPAEILSSSKMKNLIALLKSKYDYIIFDAPPVVPVTDAGLLGAQTDGVIMVIKAGHTQKGVVSYSEGLLRQAQAKLLGYVLTNIQYHIPGYIYRYL